MDSTRVFYTFGLGSNPSMGAFLGKWENWLIQRTVNPPPTIACRFESYLTHHFVGLVKLVDTLGLEPSTRKSVQVRGLHPTPFWVVSSIGQSSKLIIYWL